MKSAFGPWTSAIHACTGSTLTINYFWNRRLTMLPLIGRGDDPLRGLVWLILGGAVLCVLPTFRHAPTRAATAGALEPPEERLAVASTGSEHEAENVSERDFLEQAFESARSANEGLTKATVLFEVVKAKLHKGELEDAQRVARGIPYESKEPNRIPLYRSHALGLIAVACAQQNDYSRALEIAETIPDHSWKLGTLHAIVRVAETQNKANAEQVLWDGMRSGRSGEATADNFRPELAIAQAKAGNIEEALRSAAGVRSSHVWTTIGEAQIKAKEVAGARVSLRKALDLARNETHFKLDRLVEVAALQSRLNDRDAAYGTFQEAAKLTQAEYRYPESRTRDLVVLASGQARAGFADDAIATAVPLDNEQKAQVVREIAKHRATNEDLTTLTEWAKALPSPELRSAAFLGLFEGRAFSENRNSK